MVLDMSSEPFGGIWGFRLGVSSVLPQTETPTWRDWNGDCHQRCRFWWSSQPHAPSQIVFFLVGLTNCARDLTRHVSLHGIAFFWVFVVCGLRHDTSSRNGDHFTGRSGDSLDHWGTALHERLSRAWYWDGVDGVTSHFTWRMITTWSCRSFPLHWEVWCHAQHQWRWGKSQRNSEETTLEKRLSMAKKKPIYRELQYVLTPFVLWFIQNASKIVVKQ